MFSIHLIQLHQLNWKLWKDTTSNPHVRYNPLIFSNYFFPGFYLIMCSGKNDNKSATLFELKKTHKFFLLHWRWLPIHTTVRDFWSHQCRPFILYHLLLSGTCPHLRKKQEMILWLSQILLDNLSLVNFTISKDVNNFFY